MFQDREDAAVRLSKKLKNVVNKNTVVIALTRGGVILGKVIGDYFSIAWGAIVVKKITAPFNSELAIGAVAPNNIVYWNEKLCKELGITKEEKLRLRERKEVERISQEIIFKKPGIPFKGKDVILVDDGVATGATVKAASRYLKKKKAKKILLAVPVVSKGIIRDIKTYFDTIISLSEPKDFYAVGEFYKYFPQVTNREVINLLDTRNYTIKNL